MNYRDAKRELDILGVTEEVNGWLESIVDAFIEKLIHIIGELAP